MISVIILKNHRKRLLLNVAAAPMLCVNNFSELDYSEMTEHIIPG